MFLLLALYFFFNYLCTCSSELIIAKPHIYRNKTINTSSFRKHFAYEEVILINAYSLSVDFGNGTGEI